MPILADEYNALLRELRKLRCQLKAEKQASDALREEVELLSGELQRVTTDLHYRHEELQAARAESQALQDELGRVRAERDNAPTSACRYCTACARCPYHDGQPSTAATPAGLIIVHEVTK